MLLRERPRGSGFAGLWTLLAWVMTPRRVKLDERGSLLWRYLDGATTVAGLARILQRERPDDAKDSEARVAGWLQVLADHRLIELRREGWGE